MKVTDIVVLVIMAFVVCSDAAAQSRQSTALDFPKPVSFQDIQLSGVLKDRAELNNKRLLDAYFQWANISAVNFQPFPGDAIGRDINGLTLLSQALHKPIPASLSEIMRRLPELENGDGYLGPKLSESRANEDVLAAHNGLTCGLAEYVNWTHDRTASETLRRVIENLIVPSQSAIQQYRVTKPQIEWRLSGGDIGQLFLLLDGATRAYQVHPSPQFKATIETMIDRYHGLDLVGISAQTHAMLSATNGILRWYELQRRPDDLLFAQMVFRMYRGLAMTDTFENDNWINRPTWTEGCAVVDSFLLTTNLWRLTGDSAYLADAHRILYNGLLPGQCTNGGFGTGPCVGAVGKAGQVIVEDSRHGEAPFCCSMRGAEGLARAIQFNFFVRGNECLVPFYNEGIATIRFQEGNCIVEEKTSYPYSGLARFVVKESSLKHSVRLRLFIPPWAKRDTVTVLVNGVKTVFPYDGSFAVLNLRATKGTTVDLAFQQMDEFSTAHNPNNLAGAHRYFHGALLLGSKSPTELPKVPLLDLLDPLKSGQDHVQVLFITGEVAPTAYSSAGRQPNLLESASVYRRDAPDDPHAPQIKAQLGSLKLEEAKTLFGAIWPSPRVVKQVILQWPKEGVLPSVDNIAIIWSDRGIVHRASLPGIIGNGRQWIYSLDTSIGSVTASSLAIATVHPDSLTSLTSVPDVTVIGT